MYLRHREKLPPPQSPFGGPNTQPRPVARVSLSLGRANFPWGGDTSKREPSMSSQGHALVSPLVQILKKRRTYKNCAILFCETKPNLRPCDALRSRVNHILPPPPPLQHHHLSLMYCFPFWRVLEFLFGVTERSAGTIRDFSDGLVQSPKTSKTSRGEVPKAITQNPNPNPNLIQTILGVDNTQRN